MIFPRSLANPSSAVVGILGSQGEWTEAELAAAVSQSMRWLTALNLNRSELVAVATSGAKEMWATHLALLHLGIPIMPITHDMPTDRAQRLISGVSPQCILKTADAIATVDGIPTHLLPSFTQKKSKLMSKLLAKKKSAEQDHPALSFDASWPEELSIEAQDNDVAYVLFTSGSTSEPKGVQLSFGNLRHHFATLQKVYGLQAGDRLMNNLSLGHADGLLQGPMLAHFAGATWIRPFDALGVHNIADFLDQPYATQATHVVAVPVLLGLMQELEHASDAFDYPEARVIISCSAALEAQRWQALESTFGLPVVNVYGLTETVAGSLFAGPEDATRVHSTVGRPVDCEIRIVDAQGNDLPAGDKGELLLRGPHTTTGYWRRPDLKASLYREDGWLATGDQAILREDGLVSITGRLKSAVNVAGFLVHPEEVSEALLELDGIRDAHCLGYTDHRGEERVGAAVVLEPGHAWNALGEGALLAAIAGAVDHRLEGYKWPASVQIWPALPRGLSGKVEQKSAQEAWQSHASTGNSAASGSVEQRLLELARAAFKNADVHIGSDSTNTRGWDSMAHLDFIVAIERDLGIRFTTAEMMKANSIRTALQVAQGHLSQK